MASVFDNNISVDASGNATIDGDLTVTGDTTTVSTTNTVIQDKLIELANGTSGTPSGDSGIIVERGSSTNAGLIWDESADTWKACTTSATGASSGNLTLTDAALAAAAITASGDITTTGDIILDDGGSLKEAGGTAAITFDGDGNVTKIGQDSPSTNEVLTYDGAKWVAASAASGDITGVTAGDGLSGGGTSGGVSLALDLNELTGATIADGDSIVFIDANDSNASRKETLADFLDVVAGTAATTGLDRSGATLVLTDLHPVGVSGSANQIITDDGDGTVTSEAKAKVDGATMTIGNGTAEDASVQFDGNTVDFYVGVDDSQDALVLGVGTALGTNVGLGINGNGQVQAFDAFGASTGGTFGTFGSSDTTPSVATGNLWKTHASEQTLSDFDDGLAGQIIVVISTAAVTFDVTSSGLKGGSTDIVTASGDVTVWAYDGTDWHLVQFMDVSADMSSVGGGGGGMSNFVLEDGDGTEVTIGDGKEVKFVEGGGIDINWTDTDNGTDGDPYDLTFTVSSTGVSSAMVTDGVRTAADQAGEIFAAQVFS